MRTAAGGRGPPALGDAFIDTRPEAADNHSMKASTVKSDLREIADKLPDSASYDDAMYELYVRMKIAQGLNDLKEGRVVPHDEVKRRFSR